MHNILSGRAWLIFFGAEFILLSLQIMIGLHPVLLLASGFALLGAVWIWDNRPDWIPVGFRERLWLHRLFGTVSNSTASVSTETVTVIPPRYRYHLAWRPDTSLQIITDIRHIPAGMVKPDTRIPIYYLKNLTSNILRHVDIELELDSPVVELAVMKSAPLRKYNALILSDFAGAPVPMPGFPISYKALQMSKNDGSGGGVTYQKKQAFHFDFIDPFGEVEFSPQKVFSAIEILLTALLAGAPLNRSAEGEIICRVASEGKRIATKRLSVMGVSLRAQFSSGIIKNQDDADVDLAFRVTDLSL